MDPQPQADVGGHRQPPAAEPAVYHDSNTVVRLAVTVHRATNLEIGVVRWSLPWIVASLGGSRSQSRECRVKDGSAEFDWSTELRYTGSETHLTFAVHSGEYKVIGLCIVPVAEVLRREAFRKALPLLRNGHARRGFGQDDKLSELYVTVACVHADPGTGTTVALRNKAAQELWGRCAQVRIVIRALRLEPPCLSDKPAGHRPYVFAALGVQEYRTMTARKVTRREAEEFVFCPPRRRFTCDDCFTSDSYEGPLVDPPKGSEAVPAYRKKANGEVHVFYKDVRFVFWLAQQSLLQLDVFDDYTFSSDKLLASGSLDFVDLFQRVLQGGANLQTGEAGPTHQVSMEVPLLSRSRQKRELEGTAAGTLEIEVEFLREPLALPSQLEGVFRGLNKIVRQRTEQRREAVRGVQAMLAGSRPAGRTVGSIAALPESVRSALAGVLTAVAITDTRQSVQHEDDSPAAVDNLTNAVQVFASLLAVPEQQAAELLAAAHSMKSADVAQEQVISTYRRSCTDHSVSELLPFAELFEELLRRFGGYSAKVYMTLMHAGASVLPHRSDSRIFVEVIERHLVLAMQGGAVPAIPDPERACPSFARLAETARDLADGETAREHPPAEVVASSWSWFLPSVDTKRLLEPMRKHPGDEYGLIAEMEHRVFYGTAATALLAAILGGVSTIALAKMIKVLEHDILCVESGVMLFGLRQALCYGMKAQNIDNLIIDLVSSTIGFSTFALAYFVMYGYEAYTRLYTRYSAIKELALEPLGPPSSFHAVLCASGFLTSLSDIVKPWAVDAECPWTSGQVIAVRYETGILMRLGFELLDMLAWATKSTYWVTMGVLYCSNPVSMSCYVMDWLLAEFDDLFDVACYRAEQAGRRLAHQLVQSYAGQGRPVRPVTLVAFSSGAVVMYSCLQELRRLVDSGEAPVAANIVCDVVLLGAPVPADDLQEWVALRPLVSGRFVNGYLPNDMTLVSYKARRGIGVLMGVEGLHQVPGVENMSMNDFITKHVDYAKQMPAILAHIMRG